MNFRRFYAYLGSYYPTCNLELPRGHQGSTIQCLLGLLLNRFYSYPIFTAHVILFYGSFFLFTEKRLLVPKGVARGISFTGVSLGLGFENCVHNCDRINPPLLNVLRNLPIIGPGNVFQVLNFPMQPLEMI